MRFAAFLHKVGREAARHAEYRRIRAELAGMSFAEQLDCGLNPDDADRLARAMVYR